MKKSFQYISLVLCFAMFFCLFSGFAYAETSSETTIEAKDAKIYSHATLEDEFDDSSVLVILDGNTGGINQQHHKDFFGDVEISAIVDLTEIEPEHIKSTKANQRAAARRSATPASRRAGIDYENSQEKILEVDPETFRQILKLELPVHSKQNVLNVIGKLEKIDGIKYAGPNYIETIEMTEGDTWFPAQWALQEEYMNVEQAWNITTGVNTVRVGIMDTGISNHSDLEGNLVAGWDFAYNNAITDDWVAPHGTQVAGIVGAVGNNFSGISGVCQNVSLVPLQVFDANGNLENDWLVVAVTYAINNNISIINCSLGGYEADAALAQAIANYPGLFVCSAGNDSVNTDQVIHYPSDLCRVLPNVISVGASDQNDEICSEFSNFGANTVNLFAPGIDILSTYPQAICDLGLCSPEDHASNGYHFDFGTSFAAPQVTGTAALIMSLRPDLTAQEVKDCILNSVDLIPALSGLCTTGGRLNTYKAVQMATEPQTFSGDVNGDGRADVVLSRNINGYRALTTYLGQANGAFGEPITTNMTDRFFYDDPAFVGDVNGDGRTDVIIHWESGGYRQLLVYTGNANGTFSSGANFSSTRRHDPISWPCQFFVGDVNGDNRDDFIVHWRNNDGLRSNLVYTGTTSGSFNDATTTFTSSNKYVKNDPVFIGDVNGDGRTDMIVHWASEGKRCLLVYQGTASGSFGNTKYLSSIRNHDPIACPAQFFVTDMNGDGYDDFVVHWKSVDGNRCNLVYNGTANGIFTEGVYAINSIDTYVATDPAFMGDVNGDGCSDVIVHWRNSADKRNLLVYRANTNTTYNTGVNFLSARTQNPILLPAKFLVADVNNDGRDDFIVKWKNGNTISFLTYLGTASATFNEGILTIPNQAIPYFNYG